MNFAAAGAILQQAQDTASLERFKEGIPQHPPPIPGPVETVLRAVFNAPAWMWVVGLLLVLGLVGFLVRLLWKQRKAIPAWISTRGRPVKLALAGLGLVVLGVAAWGGTRSWNYMQHENGFCMGCHIMEGPWNKFSLDAGKHSELRCHDCHQQSLYASTRQLVLWVADRPEKIPPHSKVPSERCEACHAKNESEKWTRIKETAGHRTHLESDSTALKDVQCVTCHGATVHEFIPANKTCGQSGCHEKLEIRLGKMAAQTELHCVQCHQFTAEVPKLATRDSAAGTLRPGSRQCLGCHEMQKILNDFDPALDPHKGVCGTCHNPHTQETPQAAATTCTTAQCHANWPAVAFHAGTIHRRVAPRCLVCHQQHTARVDASDCVACHTKVTSRFGSLHLRPPLPFDTTRALRPIPGPEESLREREAVPSRDLPPSTQPALLPAGREETGNSRFFQLASLAPVESGEPRCAGCHEPSWAPPPSAPADSFPHSRHQRLPCLTCHATGNLHGRLTFEPPRGCQICHHQASQQANCTACHSLEQRQQPRIVTVSIAVRDSAPRSRSVSFPHVRHAKLRCVECHSEPVTMAPSAAARGCRDCHENHHTANRSCSTCHQGEQLRRAHEKDVSASHRACAACHTAATVSLLTPDRSFCLTCHESRTDHYPAGQCSTCHFLKSPEELRRVLNGPPDR
jgi:nitrate/TMAO reductase-like tetraheme cytochrome c subunit